MCYDVRMGSLMDLDAMLRVAFRMRHCLFRDLSALLDDWRALSVCEDDDRAVALMREVSVGVLSTTRLANEFVRFLRSDSVMGLGIKSGRRDVLERWWAEASTVAGLVGDYDQDRSTLPAFEALCLVLASSMADESFCGGLLEGEGLTAEGWKVEEVADAGGV